MRLNALGEWCGRKVAVLRSGSPAKRFLLLAAALGLAWMVFGGSHGFFALVSLQRQKWRLQSEIQDLGRQNLAMKQRCEYLRTHPEYYEKIAREQLMLAKPGEIIYRFDGPAQ